MNGLRSPALASCQPVGGTKERPQPQSLAGGVGDRSVQPAFALSRPRTGNEETQATPLGLVSTFAKVGLKLRRPLRPDERTWLRAWVTSPAGRHYFKHHRRLARGLASKLRAEMERHFAPAGVV